MTDSFDLVGACTRLVPGMRCQGLCDAQLWPDDGPVCVAVTDDDGQGVQHRWLCHACWEDLSSWFAMTRFDGRPGPDVPF